MISSRILFITPSAYILSGLATWLNYLDPGLRERGWDVTIGLVEGLRHHRPEKYLSVYPHKKWLPVSCRTGTPEGRTRTIIRAIRHVQPDIVASVNIPDVYSAVSRLRYKGHFSPKAVATLHGIQADLYNDILACNSVLDGVVCTNRLSCHLTHVLGGIPEERIYYAPYGSNFSLNRSYPVEKEYLEIAYIGRLEKWQKRVHDIPLILEQLDEMNIPYILSIAGDGPEEESLRLRLKDFVHKGKVRFLGRLSISGLQDMVYPKADTLLLTSLWETGPIVIWEAMASGLAVVSSQYIGSGLEGALEHEKNSLLFPIGDTRLAAQQLARLWKDSALIKKLVKNGHNMVSQRYSIEASVKSWDNAFQQILRTERSPTKVQNHMRPATGRLDRWFRPKIAETIRELLQSQGPDSGPGGEWPHSYGNTPNDDPYFWQVAKSEDYNAPDNDIQSQIKSR